ncbi:hypothetical protein [Paenibacillus sp.]
MKWANCMAVSLAFEVAVDSAEGVGGYTDARLYCTILWGGR